MNNIKVNQHLKDIRCTESCTKLTDSVSSMTWGPMGSNLLAITLWDGSFFVYQLQTSPVGPAIVQKFGTKLPVIATKCAWSNSATGIYLGNADGTVKLFDVANSSSIDIGKHNSAISSLQNVPGQNLVISTAYENSVQFWSPGNPQPAYTLDAGNKVFASDYQNGMFAAATAREQFVIADMNRLQRPTFLPSANLGEHSQLQCITVHPKKEHIGLASFDGRGHISSIKDVNGSYEQAQVITFKSNRVDTPHHVYYPVNAASFHPTNDTFCMTAGSDGFMHIWDFVSRKNTVSFSYNKMPICCAKVAPTGNMIAYALGNDWHTGTEGVNKWVPQIGVTKIDEYVK